MIGGSIVHTGTLDDNSTRYIVLGAIGTALMISGSVFEARLNKEGVGLTYCAIATALAIATDFLSGGIRHFLDNYLQDFFHRARNDSLQLPFKPLPRPGPSVWTPRPATWMSLTSKQINLQSLNMLGSRFSFFYNRHPTNPLVTRQWCQLFPELLYFWFSLKRLN